MLIAVLILTLVSQCMIFGIVVAKRQYQKSLTESEALLLCSTLEMLLTNEIQYSSGDSALVSLDDDNTIAEYGELAFEEPDGYRRILGNASYPKELKVKADFLYDHTQNHVNVFISIKSGDSLLIDRHSFQILLLEN